MRRAATSPPGRRHRILAVSIAEAVAPGGNDSTEGTDLAGQPGARERLTRLPAWAGYLLLAGGYFVLGRLGYLLLDPATGIAVFWPPSGLLLAAFLLVARRRWVLVVAATLPPAVLGSMLRGRAPGLALWLFAGNVLEALAGAWLVLRFAGPRPWIRTLRGALALATLPALAAGGISAALEALRALAGGGAFGSAMWVFWGGSSVGALVVAPLLLAFAEPPSAILPLRGRAAELAALCAAVALALAASAPNVAPWAHEVVLIPPLLWAATRFGVRGATLTLAAVAVATVPLGSAGPSVGASQFFLATVVVTVLLVAAASEERGRAARDLEASRDLIDAFFARSPTGMFIKDDRHRAVVLSASFTGLFGMPLPEMLGRSVDELVPGTPGAEMLDLERAALAAGAPVERELRLGERTILSVVFPTPRRDAPAYVGGFAVEVTDRVRAEAALRASEERLRLIEAALDQSSDAVSVFDEEGRFVWVNAAQARVSGLSKERLVGASLFAIVPDADPLAWRERWDATVARGVAVEERPISWGGRIVTAEVASVVVQFGGRRYLVASSRDLSDRKRAEEAARLAGIGTLFAGVAHEINNPLAYIVSNLAWLAEQLATGSPEREPDDELRHAVEEAQDGAARVRDVVRRLRLFARPDETLGRVDAREAAKAAIAIARNEIRHRAQLVTRLAEELPPVLGNENRLVQVVLNLLTNAAQAIPAGRADRERIAVDVRAGEGATVVLEVSDTGAGIDPAARSRIFEPFFTTKPIGEGTGLGLFLCHEIVTQAGGRIEVESAPGAGSTFRVVLPVAPAAAEGDGANAGEPAPAARRGRVLVVDDDVHVSTALRRVLQRDHDVDVVNEPRAALARVRAGETWDVVFCDLMMPVMTGMEWFEEVRRTAPALAARVVFVTGGAFTEAARAFLDAVPNARLEKPFTPADVRALVASRLAA